jgi:ABC-type transport system involved in cytochrome bd biosynthesis fused ATPase/permease subunit
LTEWHLGLGNNQIDIDTKAEQLSAGEMQFLAICRTLVRNPKLVIFDEATNSIDIDSEPQIWPMIQKALPEATVFVVSHREVSSIHFDHEEVIAHF